MRAALCLPVLLAGLGLSACMTEGDSGAAPSSAGSAVTPTARAALSDKNGAAAGRATLTQESGGVRLVVEASGLTPGEHGLHVHTTGKCDAPDFTTAGPHWNPTGTVHGKDAPGGPHVGDVPNITAGGDGNGRIETLIAGATLTGGANPLLDADGAAVVVHAAADDYRTDPSGNSGGRISCGVVQAG